MSASWQIEYWRSRLVPRELVYWRYVNHTRNRYLPDCGTPLELARLIRAAVARYGTPRRTIRQGVGGPVMVLTFHTALLRSKRGGWDYRLAAGVDAG